MVKTKVEVAELSAVQAAEREDSILTPNVAIKKPDRTFAWLCLTTREESDAQIVERCAVLADR